MAVLTTKQGISVSGWAVVIGAEEDDIARFEQEELAAMRDPIPERMKRALEFVVAEIKKTLDRSVGRGASAPGDPPARITGRLRDSWKAGRGRWTQNRTVYTGTYESRHPAAGRLEFGDDPTGKGFVLHLSRRAKREVKGGIAARPYVRPTLERIADKIDRILLGDG